MLKDQYHPITLGAVEAQLAWLVYDPQAFYQQEANRQLATLFQE